MKNKKYFSILVMVLVLTSCSTSNSTTNLKNEELPIYYNEARFVVDTSKPEEIIGWSDYVFLAKVNEEVRTEYTGVRKRENGETTGSPSTIYSITVIDNLKGKIKKNTPVEFKKDGGINMDGKSISLLEGDELLKEGKYYIIMGVANDDGELGQGIKNGSILIPAENKSEAVSSKEYKKYKEYVKNEVRYERDRSKSTYEE